MGMGCYTSVTATDRQTDRQLDALPCVAWQ